MRIRVVLQIALVVTWGIALSAHHAVRSVYDTATIVPLAGAISRVQIMNPHVTVNLEVRDADGRVTTWTIEMLPPGVLKRKAFDVQLLEAGRQVVIESWLRSDGQTGQANGRTLVLPDGRRFDIGDNWDQSMTFTPPRN
jgi:hypothetical protein